MGGEVALLKVRESAFACGRRIEPALFVSVARIEIAHSENRDRKESDGHEWQRARGRFQRTTDDDAPVSAGQMLQHDEAKGTYGQAENEKKTHQVRLIKKFGGAHSAENRNHQRDAPNQ